MGGEGTSLSARVAMAVGALALIALAVAVVIASRPAGPAAPEDVIGVLREEARERPVDARAREDVRRAVAGLRRFGTDGEAAADAAARPRGARDGYTVFSAGDRVCIAGVGRRRQFACAFSDVMRDGRHALALPTDARKGRARLAVLVADGIEQVRVHTDRGSSVAPVRDNLATPTVRGAVRRVTWKTAGGAPAGLSLPAISQ